MENHPTPLPAPVATGTARCARDPAEFGSRAPLRLVHNAGQTTGEEAQ